MNGRVLASTERNSAVRFRPRSILLQRKCGCSQQTTATTECPGCKRKGGDFLRRAGDERVVSEVPSIVHEVLGGPGRLLNPEARAFFEPRFGHDFSGVRVHTDAKAAESARAVNALAYTVGRDIVFGEGRYAPASPTGQTLLAHELTHVLQQERGNGHGFNPRPALGPADTPAEREADAVASAMLVGPAVCSVGSSSIGSTLQRKNGEPIDVELVPSEPVPGIDLPTVSPETWRLIGGSADNAGMTLSEPERQQIAKITREKAPSGSPLAFAEGPRFLLHDTASLMSAAKLTEEQKLGRGPLGAGVTAWVPRSGGTVVARPQFFEARRPSTTEFEKAADIIEQGPREQAFRKVWTATSGTEKTDALDRALDGLGLTEAELKTEKKNAQDQLNAGSGKIFTTAAWTVGEICSRVGAAGAKAIAAAPAKEGDLSAGCKTLADYFKTRAARVGSMVSVEIVQESGLKKTKAEDKTVSENACDPTNPNLKPLPKPAYNDSQYAEIVLLYLRACLQAGRFPEITTHFHVDAFKSGHCDPRCFDLSVLYKSIARTLGHGEKSTYGVRPSYGTKWGTNTVWWDNTICGGGPPS